MATLNFKNTFRITIASLALANVVFFCVGSSGKQQVIKRAMESHRTAHDAFLVALEEARVKAEKPESEELQVPGAIALNEIQKKLTSYRFELVDNNSKDSNTDKKAAQILQSKPVGAGVTIETSGIVRSYYNVPVSGTPYLRVGSSFKEEVTMWKWLAAKIAAVTFFCFFGFAWLWTRRAVAQTASQPNAQPQTAESFKDDFSERLRAVNAVAAEMKEELEKVKATAGRINPELARNLDEISKQIRVLAVNGSIEAARSSEGYRVFHVLLQEINQLANQQHEIITKHVASESDQQQADSRRVS